VKKWADNNGTLLQPLREEPTNEEVDNAGAGLMQHTVLKPGYILRSKAFMVTFNSRSFSLQTWGELLPWAQERARTLAAKAWAVCLEETDPKHEKPGPQVYHAHAYFYWTDGQGLFRRNLEDLRFQEVYPRIDKCSVRQDVTPHTAACHGLWYVYVMKLGTCNSASNFLPWQHYNPRGGWLQKLWEAKKLSHDQFLQLSQQFRTGHSQRKRDVEDLRREEEGEAVAEVMKAELAGLHEQAPLAPVKPFPEVEHYLSFFSGAPHWRRPFLVVVGATNFGKSLLAADVLRRVGELLHLPDYLEVTVEEDATLDLSGFSSAKHAGVLLDGVADVLTLKKHREALQGRPKLTKGGRSQTMMYAYDYSLCRRAVVATCDLAAENLHLLKQDHWLSNPQNVVTLWLEEPAWVGAPRLPAEAASQRMGRWTVAEVASFLRMRDLAGPAKVLAESGVNGNDLLGLRLEVLTAELRLSTFAARKVVLARDAFQAEI